MTDFMLRNDYFAKREAQERALAERAADIGARHAHLAMANHYAKLTEQAPVQSEPLPASHAA